MAKDEESRKCDCECHEMQDKVWWKHAKKWHKGGGGGAPLYGLGIIGALFYFLPHSGTFTEVVVGIIKSLAWPAVLVFKALELLRV